MNCLHFWKSSLTVATKNTQTLLPSSTPSGNTDYKNKNASTHREEYVYWVFIVALFSVPALKALRALRKLLCMVRMHQEL